LNFRAILAEKSALAGLVIVLFVMLVAIFAPVISPANPLKQNLAQYLKPPSHSHYFGTDELGRDLFSRVIYGARTSLALGILPILLATAVGTVIGVTSGYAGGRVDEVIMRATDLLMSVPYFLLAILIVASFGPNLVNAMIAVGVSFIADFIRMVRASTLAAREEDYVRAEKALGAGHLRIMFGHILPNIISPVLVLVTLKISEAILAAAALSFIGLGAQPPTPEWGLMLAGTREYLLAAPYLMIFPGVAIIITSLGFNLLGDGLRDLLDPRYKGLI
jgi:peptide/nickel transport system permease protein